MEEIGAIEGGTADGEEEKIDVEWVLPVDGAVSSWIFLGLKRNTGAQMRVRFYRRPADGG